MYCAITEHTFVNRGFLFGPLCPIYGIGALLVLFVLQPFKDDLFNLFWMAILISGILEYSISWIMEKMFSTRWWDYSSVKFNLNGRICLKVTLIFGSISVLAVRVVHPLVLAGMEKIPLGYREIACAILSVVFMADFVMTLKTLFTMKSVVSRLSDLTDSLDSIFEPTKAIHRLVRAFPSMTNKKHTSQLDILKTMHKKKPAVKRVVSAREKEKKIFKKGLTFYRSVWLFLIGGSLGSGFEMVWSIISTGHLQNRSGFIYGMIIPVYGFAALLLTFLVSKQAKRSNFVLFVASVIIGGIFEYACSFVQEFALGTVSWDYSESKFNILGRTNLIFALMWGVLVLFWVRELYPHISRFISRIPVKPGKIITLVLFFALSVDAGISSVAVYRWAHRQKGIAPENRVDTFVDAHYSDQYMKKIFPNMQFIN